MAVASSLGAYPTLRTCPRCGATDTQDLIAQAGYHCRRCAFELVHLELTPSGGVRRVIGWLRAPGDVVGDRYRVTTVLGKGGYAATYLVEDNRLEGKRRALKEIPEECYDEHETRLLSRLHHAAIPDITDRLEADGMVYLVLEFGGTQTLESERRRSGGRVRLDRVASWMTQVCDVLAYLHEQTPPIVHRDLKPANILLDEHNRVMLIDFGIAKTSLGVESTRTLARAATHGFSPPEQVLGTGTDARSDVYALGATMYALLTGAPPPPAHERMTGSQLVPPRTVHPPIPADLERLILWCLELRPENRPQSVEQVRAALASGGWGMEAAQTEAVTDDVTVPMSHTPPTATAPASATRVEPHPPPAPGRATLPAWARSATTATALLGLGTAVALLRPWLPGAGHQGQTRVPEVEPASTVTTITSAPSPAVAAPVTEVPSPTTLPEPIETRIRRVLGDEEFGAITIEVTSDRIRLGKLRSTAQAQRARELVAALPGLDRPIDTEVQPSPAPTPPPVDHGSRGTSRPPRAPPRPPVERPRRQASRPPKPSPRSRATGRPASPPADWVLIPQPARRTD